MSGIFGHTLLFRISALSILTLSFILVSHSGGSSSFRPSAETSGVSANQEPTVTAEVQGDSPLVITSLKSEGRVAPDSQFVEFGFYVINVSVKPIRAYAIKQEIAADGTKMGGGVSLYNPQLTNSLLRPNQSAFIADTSNFTSDKKNTISLSVDFVEFADGTKWGRDSVKSSERAAGQRAGAYNISQRLLEGLNDGKVEDVIHQMEAANVELADDHSEEWKSGFRAGRIAILNRLKHVKAEHGPTEFERELRRLGQTFKDQN